MAGIARCRAGVDLGGTKIQTTVLDPLNQVLGTDRRMTPTTGTPAGVADAIADSVRAAAQLSNIDDDDLCGLGVGSPGQIDTDSGTVSHAANLPGWLGTYALGPELSSRLGGMPVALGNDVQVAVNAELRLGNGQGYNSLIGVFWGTGVGGGLVIDGKLWLGRGAAGEIGHTVVRAGGAECTCGRHGCMEAYAGRGAMEIKARKLVARGQPTQLFSIMKRKGRDRLSSGVWAKALAKNDPMAVKLIDRAVWALGIAIASAVNLTDVQAVVIGGGLGCRLGQPFVDRIAEAALPHLVMPDRPPAVLPALLGDLGGAIGAGLLVEQTAPAPVQRRPRSPRAPTRKAPAKKAPAKKAPAKTTSTASTAESVP